ncbi:MerR family transcriptional regulator [Streptomyces sp. NPDC127166]|uniref:MerR family transcriptional regulator n=1 Tax=Streptomyces sp. NPDC127166 TaxID=3345380 RepID=UPI00363561D9
MPAFSNPDIYDLDYRHLGTIWEAARIAGVKPGTIRVWESRGKIERVQIDHRGALYHLPTVERASKVKPGRRPKAA